MYLVSIYFDEKTNKRIQGYIDDVAKASGNSFMTDHTVPPHITVSAFETRDEAALLTCMEGLEEKLESWMTAQKSAKDSVANDANVAYQIGGRQAGIQNGMLEWVTVGQFFPSVMYVAPVLNTYLHELSVLVHESIHELEDVSVSRFYLPLHWLPHCTIGKTLSQEEMQAAFCEMQNLFGVFNGKVVRMELAKKNPYRVLWSLKMG